MSTLDDTIHSYEVREIVAHFSNADAFEAAVEMLVEHQIRRDAINMIASHDAVREKLGHLYKRSSNIEVDQRLPQTIFTDRHDVANKKVLAIGVPVYIGGIGTGLAVVASGGALAFAALIAAAGAAIGAGVGALMAHSIGSHHDEFLEEQL